MESSLWVADTGHIPPDMVEAHGMFGYFYDNEESSGKVSVFHWDRTATVIKPGTCPSGMVGFGLHLSTIDLCFGITC